LREEIDRTFDELYEPINNGVYHVGFAMEQAAYEEAVTDLFEALDRWEEVPSGRRHLCGDRVTEADWAFFTTLIRVSTPSITTISSVTCGVSWITQTCGAT
jgi:glutathionyl-hydroquinone reductase